jgi:UDP:flavonoid glycosyltransferase YjiC (YdhE family)
VLHSRHIVIAPIGSLGDLHPCLALALELKRRGHRLTIAAAEHYRTKIEALGLVFRPMRPHFDLEDRDLIAQCSDMKRGVEVLFRNIVLPHLPSTYDDLLAICADADLLMAGEINYAAPLVAEKLHLFWVSIILSPASFLSAHDPSVLSNVPGLIHLRKLGRPAYRSALELGRILTRHWWDPVRQLRRQQGLRPECEPLFKDKFSPHLVLALFSGALAEKQPDWPAKTLQPGFVFYDNDKVSEASTNLTAFLAAGRPPIIFTLGSTAVHDPGNFFTASCEAAKQLHRRALLIGSDIDTNSDDILSVDYAPYSEVFAHASVIVHQGGSGTTGQAMRAGKPMLIVPYGWDQPDNAARICRLGIGLTMERNHYSAKLAAAAIRQLLENPSFSTRAAEAALTMRQENALTTACNAIESVMPPSHKTNAPGR